MTKPTQHAATNASVSAAPPSTDRRKFLKSAGIAGGILATGIPHVHAASDSTIRVGLVGCGGRGSGAAINAMMADPNVRIVALADLFDESMQSCRRSLEKGHAGQFIVTDEMCFDGFDGYKTMMEHVDVVLLAAPPHYRPDHIEAAVDAGKEIFCEKPVATDAVGVRRVAAACKKAEEKGLNVVSGLCWRYDRGMIETMARVHDGEVGTVVTSQHNFLTNPVWIRPRKPGESDMQYQCRNWYYFTWLSGDHIVEQHIHSIDKALWLHHDVAPVQAYGLGGRQIRSDLTQGDIYDHFAVVFEWADGTRAHTYTRQMPNCFSQVEDFAFGSLGRASLVKHEIQGANPWKFEADKVQMHQAEQDEFFKAIRGERERINNGEFMCRSTLTAILGREVCYTGKQMKFDDIAASTQDLRPKSYQWGDAPAVSVPQPGTYRHPV